MPACHSVICVGPAPLPGVSQTYLETVILQPLSDDNRFSLKVDDKSLLYEATVATMELFWCARNKRKC